MRPRGPCHSPVHHHRFSSIRAKVALPQQRRDLSLLSAGIRMSKNLQQQSTSTRPPAEYLWIGCSDAQQPPENQIVGLSPGEIVVHRNIANLVLHTDLSCLSVVQYSIDVIKVKHIMVVGHLNCDGIRTALKKTNVGIANAWLRPIHDINAKHGKLLSSAFANDDLARANRLSELNVIEQVMNLANSSVVQVAWKRGQHVALHACIYAPENGLLCDLGFHLDQGSLAASKYATAINNLFTTTKKA